MAFKFGNINIESLKPSNLYSAYFGLTPREQTMALVAAGVALILIVILPVTVASSRIGKLENDVIESKKQLKDVMNAIETYDRKKIELIQTQKSMAGGFDSALSSTLETIAENNGIKDRIDSLKEKPVTPSDTFDEASVDVRLKKVSLQQAVDFLYAIERHPEKIFRLKQLQMKPRFDNKQEFDMSFTVSTYKLLEVMQDEGAGEKAGEKALPKARGR